MEIIEQSRAEYYKNKISEELKNIENKNSFDSNALASILEEMELDIDVIIIRDIFTNRNLIILFF